MKKLFVVVCAGLLLTLGGCASDTKEYNTMVQQANLDRQAHIATALSEAKTSEAVVAMSILFAVGAGQQHFVRPDTALDYMKAALPVANLFLQGYQLYGGFKSEQSGYHLEGNNNNMFVTNEKNSRNTSTLNRDSFNTHTEEFWQAGGTIGDSL